MKEENNQVSSFIMGNEAHDLAILKAEKEKTDRIDNDNALMSADISQWATAFCEAQSVIEKVIKNKKADNGRFSYNYAGLDEVLEKAKDALNAHGLCLTQLPKINEKGKTVLVTLIIHKVSGQWIKSVYPVEPVIMLSKEGKETSNPVQQLGSAFSYARRYSILPMLGIAQEDDDAQSLTKKATPALEVTLSHELLNLCAKHGISAGEFARFHKIDSAKPETVKDGVNNFVILKEKFLESLNENTH